MDDSYIAGFFDGEGCICISSIHASGRAFRYRLIVTITNTHLPVMKKLETHLNIKLQHRESIPHRREAWSLMTSDAGAETIIRRLLPFLIVKKEQAELALVFRTATNEDDTKEWCYHEMSRINRGLGET